MLRRFSTYIPGTNRMPLGVMSKRYTANDTTAAAAAASRVSSSSNTSNQQHIPEFPFFLYFISFDIVVYSTGIDDTISVAFRLIYPDFIPTPIWGRRNALREELERMDMLERRMHLDIPEFYVGSIVAVTCSDANMGNRQNRFLGICINRSRSGLSHRFTLRNVVDGLGVEVMYELYNPTILKIETIKLERRLDDDLTYLMDALPEYSTFDFNLEPVAHPAGAPVPVNPLKVKMRPPPWTKRWELYEFGRCEKVLLNVIHAFENWHFQVNDLRKYDLIADHREVGSDLETEMKIEQEMHQFESNKHRLGATKRRILRSAANTIVRR
ncbi:unnamed protein product [Anisakis simplex]|uniref:Large ribosomal subunit protein bL19m n=1 Tax=Anisakis simplex TaxID=6269 RepID=A0A0M3JUT7_ANISI|nr:unnamed protein product [Anisakis simplex]